MMGFLEFGRGFGAVVSAASIVIQSTVAGNLLCHASGSRHPMGRGCIGKANSRQGLYSRVNESQDAAMKRYVLLLTVLTCACNERSVPVSSVAPDAAPQTAAPAEEAPLAARLNAVVQCLNEATPAVSHAAERYFSWVTDRNKGPTCAEANIYGSAMPSPYADERCRQASAATVGLGQEYAGLKQAVANYVDAYSELDPIMIQVYRYYEQEDYKDDACAWGKELHARFVPSLDRFVAADRALRIETGRYERLVALQALEEMERTAGKDANWHIQNAMIQAKNLFSSIDESTGALDREAYLKGFAAFEQAHSTFTAFAQTQKEMPYWASDFLRGDDALYAQAKIAKREFADGKVEPGRLKVLVGHYNALIQGYNNLPDHR